MTISPTEVNRWRAAIIADEWIPKYELSQMGKRDPVHFAHLCHALLREPSPVVQRVALEKMWERGDPEDAANLALTLLDTADDRLARVVWDVLGAVRPPAALPVLLRRAEHGSAEALSLADTLAQTAEDRDQVLRLARQAVRAREHPLHVTGMRVVGQHMSLTEWEDLLLEYVRQYDEDAIEALGVRGTPRVIPALQKIVDQLPPGCVESKAAMRAIEWIQSRADQGKRSSKTL